MRGSSCFYLNVVQILGVDLNDVKILLEDAAISNILLICHRNGEAKRDATYHHGDLREALVRAARTILEKQGLAALSLRGAARGAGVSPAAPYHHFPDKHALLDAVAAQGFDALTSAMEKRMAKQKSPSARLDASGVGYVVFALENPALFRLMFGGDGQQSSASAPLIEARDRAYGVLQTAVANDFSRWRR